MAHFRAPLMLCTIAGIVLSSSHSLAEAAEVSNSSAPQTVASLEPESDDSLPLDGGHCHESRSVNGSTDASCELRTKVEAWIQNKSKALAEYGPIGRWNTSAVTTMASLFAGEAHFDENLNAWNVASVQNASKLFAGAAKFTSNLSAWDVSQVEDASFMFSGALKFTSKLAAWDVARVRDASYLFAGASSFESDLAEWDVAQATDLSHLFENAVIFASDISAWDVARTRDMSYMARGASQFTSNLGEWHVAKVENMSWMFQGAATFNSDLSAWDVSGVRDMKATFARAFQFNSDLDSWDVSQAQTMFGMFANYIGESSIFASDLNSWDLSGLQDQDLSYMFQGAVKFTSSLDAWDVSRITTLTNMFFGAVEFKSDLTSWQIPYGAAVAHMFDGSAVLEGLAEDLPCWYTGSICPLWITFVGNSGARSPLDRNLGVTTVDPTAMSEARPYHVGTTYRIAPLAMQIDDDYKYSLVDAPDGFYINPKTGVVLVTFSPDDITDNTTDGTGGCEPLEVKLQVIADADNRRAEVETYTMHIAPRESFDLVLGDLLVVEKFRDQYVAVVANETTLVLVDTPYRIAARHIDHALTTVSRGLPQSITYAFKVFATSTGDLVGKELDRMSITPNGELHGEFGSDEQGTFAICITATDGGGERFELPPFELHVRQRDVDVPSYGPNSKGCANKGVPVDDSGDLFDGTFTACDCTGIALYVGENCDQECGGGTHKGAKTGSCVAKLVAKDASVILGVNAGIVLLLLLLAVGGFRYHQRRRSLRPVDFDELNRKMLQNGTLLEEQLFGNLRPRELKRSNVVLLEQIGLGAFGSVWKAMLDESAATGQPEYLVAAKKVLTVGSSTAATDDLLTEAAVMAQLEGHKNVLSIIGVVTSGSPLILVLAYCDHGSILHHLHNRAAQGNPVSPAHKLDYAAQAARGMEHLAARHFIHRDLAARNVLLTSGQSISNLVCKIADFGLTRAGRCNSDGRGKQKDCEEFYTSHKGGAIAVRWSAPEALEQFTFTQASDIWSFGILTIEIIQDGAKPFPDIKSNKGVVRFTLAGHVHSEPDECNGNAAMMSLYRLACECFTQRPDGRPQFSKLAERIEDRRLVEIEAQRNDGGASPGAPLELASYRGYNPMVSAFGGAADSSDRSPTPATLSAVAERYEYSSSVMKSLSLERRPKRAAFLPGPASSMISV
jgi:serine/threonine protein kinase